jgi:hypothetical protein
MHPFCAHCSLEKKLFNGIFSKRINVLAPLSSIALIVVSFPSLEGQQFVATVQKE